jgi:2-polyprenyl-3-methyl-5-hydroxy-6-metoxy-1,4-benzoquinol methylase
MESITEQKNTFIDRLLQSTAGMFDLLTIHIGDRLGLYAALRDRGWLTSSELATLTQTQERYVREWLEQQTVSGILEVENENTTARTRRYRLPEGHIEVLTDRDSLDYLTPLTSMLVGATRPIDRVLQAYRHGGGVPYSEYGEVFRQGQADINRPSFLKLLGTEWLPAMPDVHDRLKSSPTPRIADIGCGAGWSSIAIARTYPNAQVDGYDLDEPSVEMARQNVAEEGLSDRVRIHCRDASDPTLSGHYDLATAFECLHDMGNPVAVLQTMRQLVGQNGTVLIADERVGDTFTAKGNDVEWMMYGWSVLHCLPVGMADGADCYCGGTGTVMRFETLQFYARSAGFRNVEILPVENFFFRLYRLNP